MRFRLEYKSLLAVLIFGLACQSVPVDPEKKIISLDPDLKQSAAPWTSLDLKDAPSDFDFVVVTDRTGEHREGVFRNAMKKVNLVQPAFVLSVGDLIEGYTEDRQELLNQWGELDGMVSLLDMPFFYAAGNHDMSNEVMSELWAERFGPSFYSFTYKDVIFVVLNSELFGMVGDPSHPVPGPESQADQMEWLEKVLKENLGRRYTFVIVHQPLWDRSRPHPDWLRVEELLADRPYLVLAGHMHAYTAETRHDHRYITMATTGGGSGLRGINHGEFDHVMLISMREEGPVIANLLLDGIWDENIRTLATRESVDALEKAIRIEKTDPVDVWMETGEVAFEVKNPTSAPLQFRATLESSDQLELIPEVISVGLEPGESRRFEVSMKAASGKVDLRKAVAPTAQFSLHGLKEDGTELVVERDAWIIPLGRFVVPSSGGPISIDGDLADWSSLPFDSAGIGNANHEKGDEASFRYGVAYDQEFLYIAVDIKDSTPYHSEALVARKQDALRFSVDARPDPMRSSSGQGYFEAIKDGTLQQLATGWVSPLKAAPDPLLQRWLAPIPRGSKVASVRHPGGYSVELAIPSSWLDERQGQEWQEVRIELSVQDFQEASSHERSVLFRPNRFDGGRLLSIPGSATFSRGADAP